MTICSTSVDILQTQSCVQGSSRSVNFDTVASHASSGLSTKVKYRKGTSGRPWNHMLSLVAACMAQSFPNFEVGRVYSSEWCRRYSHAQLAFESQTPLVTDVLRHVL